MALLIHANTLVATEINTQKFGGKVNQAIHFSFLEK